MSDIYEQLNEACRQFGKNVGESLKEINDLIAMSNKKENGMSDTNIKINVETEGMEEAQEQIEMLADAYDGFPAQVTIKHCRDCTINVYPSQIRFVDGERSEE
jgi:uncharacterized protein YecA (UPF0149 family)